MTTCINGGPGVDIIATAAEIPTLGSLAINAFVLHRAVTSVIPNVGEFD